MLRPLRVDGLLLSAPLDVTTATVPPVQGGGDGTEGQAVGEGVPEGGTEQHKNAREENHEQDQGPGKVHPTVAHLERHEGMVTCNPAAREGLAHERVSHPCEREPLSPLIGRSVRWGCALAGGKSQVLGDLSSERIR